MGRKNSRRGTPPTGRGSPLEAVSTDDTECACPKAEQTRAPAASDLCSTPKMVAQIASFVVDRERDAERDAEPAAIVDRAAQLLGCDSEACVVTHPTLVSFIIQSSGRREAKELQLGVRTQFKTPGPRSSDALLSNFNIDRVLMRWASQFPKFFNCPFSMMDFEKEDYVFGRLSLAGVHSGDVMQKVFSPQEQFADGLPIRRPCDTFACVLNTDVSSGKGKHWVCIFVDMRSRRQGGEEVNGWTIEYFNSSGNPPPRAVTRWMEHQAESLQYTFGPASSAAKPNFTVRTLAVTSVSHQQSKTECGVYALYYIRSRLEGVPLTMFAEELVPDSAMLEFRKHLFSDGLDPDA